MTYATRQDLEQRHGTDEVTQRESMLEPGAVDSALADADALIDGYVATRYAVPLSPVPGNLVQVACALARYTLLGDAASDRARDDFRDAISWLRDVQAGRVHLQVAQPVLGNSPEAVVFMTSAPAVFSRTGRP